MRNLRNLHELQKKAKILQEKLGMLLCFLVQIRLLRDVLELIRSMSLSLVAIDTQSFDEQQRLVAHILKQKESEFEAVNDEQLYLEKEYFVRVRRHQLYVKPILLLVVR